MENNMENVSSMSTLGNTDSYSSSSSSSIVSVLKYIAVAFVIVVLLAVGGINLFNYLATGTQDAATGVSDTANFIKEKTANSKVKVGLKNIIGVSAIGTESIINTTANTINTGLNQIIQSTGAPNAASVTPLQNPVNNQLSQTINTPPPTQGTYEADNVSSNIQQKGKAGWCYIGESRGIRTCAQVGANDTCMSGDIFPSNDICINPTLRP